MTQGTDPIVSPDWLAAHLNDVVVLDATYFMPADQVRAQAEYETAHIPGARFFDIDAVANHDTDLPHMFPSVPVFAAATAALGIDGRRPVVVYDRSANHFSAPRVWFTLRVFGVPEVYVLDGGFAHWNGPVEEGVVPSAGLVEQEWHPDLSRVLNGPEMARIVEAGTAQIVDARGAPRFRGEAPEPRAGLASGHMPGAANVPFDTLTDADGHFQKPEALSQIFASKSGADTVVSCGSGMTAAVLALGLARTGQGARLYDGSWTEWGRGTLGPIVTGE